MHWNKNTAASHNSWLLQMGERKKHGSCNRSRERKKFAQSKKFLFLCLPLVVYVKASSLAKCSCSECEIKSHGNEVEGKKSFSTQNSWYAQLYDERTTHAHICRQKKTRKSIHCERKNVNKMKSNGKKKCGEGRATDTCKAKKRRSKLKRLNL